MSQGLRETRNGERGSAALSTPLGVLVLFCGVWENGSIIHAEGVRLSAAFWYCDAPKTSASSSNCWLRRSTAGAWVWVLRVQFASAISESIWPLASVR